MVRPDISRRAAKRKDKRAPVPPDDVAAHRGRELAAQIEDEEMRDMMARFIASVMRANEGREPIPEGKPMLVAPIGDSRRK